ncbi:MAG TPA: protein kinase [Polyangiaceae bacterium]|nr:protein kinase [Polyangiaceae bacterium]
MSVDDRRTTDADATASLDDELGAGSRYRTLLPLASGGSATLSIALAEGPAGFTKLVVLKTIRDELVQNARATRMFLEEARLSALMNHPNVVQVYEVFLQRDVPVIVMEFLDGQPLNTILARAADSRVPSLELAISILAKVLAGLHYAHTLHDVSGLPLGLIHRDVSPHNVMVTHDGQVKLIDFGIAKLARSEHRTRTGVVKGKLTYMAPEQFTGTTDHRADIFGVGVMLWEFAANQRYWGDLLEPAIIGRLVSGQLPHLHTRTRIHEDVLRICERALAPHAEDRYSSAAEMQLDLERYLASRGLVITQRAIGEFVTETCADARRRVQADIRGQLSAHGLSWTDTGDGMTSPRIRPTQSAPASALRQHEAATRDAALRQHEATLRQHETALRQHEATTREHWAPSASQRDSASGERVYPLLHRTQARPSGPASAPQASAPPVLPEPLQARLPPEPPESLAGNGTNGGAPLRLFGGATPAARAVVAILGFGTVAVLFFALGLGDRQPHPVQSPGGPAPVEKTSTTAAPSAASTPATPSATLDARGESAPSAASRIRIVASAQPAAAKWYVDDVEMASNPLQTSAARDLEWHTLRAEAKGFEPFVKKLQFDANIDVTVVLTPK